MQMPLSILIGFQYKRNMLKGAYVDINIAKNWCKSFNCETFILTDIADASDIDDTMFVESSKDLQSRIKDIINDNYCYKCKNTEDYEKCCCQNKIIIYYSGHGIKNYMKMPDETLLSFLDFRDNIVYSLPSTSEIFFIVDCCNPNGLHLPFKLQKNKFALSRDLSCVSCVTQRILLITSANEEEKSVSRDDGSVFTKYLFEILSEFVASHHNITNKNNRNLQRLCYNLSSKIKNSTGHNQTVSVYSSYIIDPVLWLWIGNNIDIISDMSLSTLIIRHTDETLSKRNLKHNKELCGEIYTQYLQF